MASKDRDFLQSYARGSDEYVRAQPAKGDDESLDDYLKRVGLLTGGPATQGPATQGPAPTTNAPARAGDRAQDRAQARAQREQERQLAEAQRAAAEEADRRKQAALTLGGILPNAAADRVDRLQAWIASRPTPGGNGALLLILLGFIAFIVPVSANYTRAQLFWLTLLGRTSIDDSAGPNGGSEPGDKGPPPAGEPGGKGPPPVSEPGLRTPLTLPMPGSNGPALPR